MGGSVIEVLLNFYPRLHQQFLLHILLGLSTHTTSGVFYVDRQYRDILLYLPILNDHSLGLVIIYAFCCANHCCATGLLQGT